jgi:hypothetical protein
LVEMLLTLKLVRKCMLVLAMLIFVVLVSYID